MKGYTLIEVILVVAIISLMSLIGMTKFGQFQKDAKLGAAADELVSELRSARSMSMAGRVSQGEVVADFEADGLPYFGVSVNGNSYEVFRDVKYFGESSSLRETIEKTQLDADFNIAGSTEVIFGRINGETSGATFVLENTKIPEKMKIEVNSLGNITTMKI